MSGRPPVGELDVDEFQQFDNSDDYEANNSF